MFENTELKNIFKTMNGQRLSQEAQQRQQLVIKMNDEQKGDLFKIKKEEEGIHLDQYIKPKTFREIIEIEAENCDKHLFFDDERQQDKHLELRDLPFKILSNKKKVRISTNRHG